MASSDQVKSLIKAHLDQNDEKFKTVILQIAASEAKQGHEIVARELKQYADKLTRSKRNIVRMDGANSMFLTSMPNDSLSDLIVSEDLEERIKRILQEYRNKNKLRQFGYCNRRKILLEGNPGTGKTFTASVIASELELPLYIVQMDKVVTKFMGETSAKLRQIFDSVDTATGVYLFDEFDAIGADRSLDNEVGEETGGTVDDSRFPYEVSRETVVFGGHDTWLKAIRPMLTGNIRFVDKDLVFNVNLVRNADVIWIQPNAMSHSQYYRVVDAARQHGKPVRYFTYASAAKGAIQLMEADSQ